MSPAGFVAVGVGAALGAWLRWWLSLSFNGILATLPLGTLAANLGGGLMIGMAVAFFNEATAIAPEWRLFIVTGFLGGLTTFSTFSAEAMALLQKGEPGWALAHSAVHLMGSVACCFAGYQLWKWLH